MLGETEDLGARVAQIQLNSEVSDFHPPSHSITKSLRSLTPPGIHTHRMRSGAPILQEILYQHVQKLVQ